MGGRLPESVGYIRWVGVRLRVPAERLGGWFFTLQRIELCPRRPRLLLTHTTSHGVPLLTHTFRRVPLPPLPPPPAAS